MTPKERRDAQIELRDIAYDERRVLQIDGEDFGWTKRIDRARLLRAVAAELDRVPEEQ